MLEDKRTNPFVEWWHVQDFQKFVADNAQSEIHHSQQSWSVYTRYFAYVDQKIVGFLICFWEMDHLDCLQLGHVGYLVAPEFRRQGLATRFLHFAMDQYRKRGIQQIYLVTDENNLVSRHLIEKTGGQLLALETIDYHGQTLSSARYELNINQNS